MSERARLKCILRCVLWKKQVEQSGPALHHYLHVVGVIHVIDDACMAARSVCSEGGAKVKSGKVGIVERGLEPVNSGIRRRPGWGSVLAAVGCCCMGGGGE